MCPECQAALPLGTLEEHRRREHHLVPFRGALLALDDLFAQLAERLDADVWRELEAPVREQFGARADAALARSLGRVLSRLSSGERGPRTAGLATVLAAAAPPSLAAALAADAESSGRRLALAVLARRPRPLDPSLLSVFAALLADRGLPVRAQLAALAAEIRTGGRDGPHLPGLLEALTQELGRTEAARRLQRLERAVGPIAAVETVRAGLWLRRRMQCPRCNALLRRPAMIRHLWQEHRLVLDRGTVREPWALIDDWLEASRNGGDDGLLQRCEELAVLVDGVEGRLRLQRRLLARGLADQYAHPALLADVRRRRASLCPWCYAAVPVADDAPPPVLQEAPGRLEAAGYALRVADRGWRPRLRLETPAAATHCPEPGRYWTRRGAIVLTAGPWVLLALATAVLVPPGPALPWLAAALLLISLGGAVSAYALWQPPSAAQLREYAWELLAPRALEDESTPQGANFLAALALRTVEQDEAPPAHAPWREAVRRTAALVPQGKAAPGAFAALARLELEADAAEGLDPAPTATARVDACFRGELPLVFAARLFSDRRSAWWMTGNTARLRALLCDRAFEAGCEVSNLLDLARSAPPLAKVLRTEQPGVLATLRYMWSQRPQRPWDRFGEVRTAFELAGDAAREDLFEDYPDLLFVQEELDFLLENDDGSVEPLRIILCSRGLVVQGNLFQAPPRRIEATGWREASELFLDRVRFRAARSLDVLATRVQRWFEFGCEEFLPEAAKAVDWRCPDRAVALRIRGATACPECGRFLMANVGEVGLALDEAVQ
jgi:hypothetical protein